MAKAAHNHNRSIPAVVFRRGIQKTEDRSQKSEVRIQKTEVRKQKSEDRRQKTEVRRQKSENRSQKTEGRRQNLESCLQKTGIWRQETEYEQLHFPFVLSLSKRGRKMQRVVIVKVLV